MYLAAPESYYTAVAEYLPLIHVYESFLQNEKEHNFLMKAEEIFSGQKPKGKSDVGVGERYGGFSFSIILSRRESELLSCLAEGLSNKEIGERLFISEGTVKWHVNNIFSKLKVKNRTQAINAAREIGLL